MKTFVTSGEGLPEWASPISHAVVVDNICYLSGQLSIDKSGKYIPGTAREEAARAFDNLFAAIAAADFAVSDLVFVDIAFIDLSDFGEINELYVQLFPEGKRPARTVYQAAALPYGGRIKVTGVAVKERAAG
jgi:enamine deaminase RidA (YjgF/YER057c/UK114 family)